MADAEHGPNAPRRQIHVKVCESAYEAWECYSRRQGVTLAALIDAIGHQLEAAAKGKLEAAAAAAARDIDAERRRRG